MIVFRSILCLTLDLYVFVSILCLDLYVLCLGPVCSGLLRHWPGLFGDILRLLARFLFRSAEQGAQSIVFAATHTDITQYQGKVIHDCTEWTGTRGMAAGGRREGIIGNYKLREGLWRICDGLSQQHLQTK